MNYYDEILEKIDKLILDEEYEEAKRLIRNELDIAYVPRDVENKLYDYLDIVNANTFRNNSLSIEDIEKYLFMDDAHQLMAVSELDRYNLRDHLELCQRYFDSKCNVNARAYLILSLIIQEVDHEFSYMKDGHKHIFNPSKIEDPQNTDAFKAGLNALSERFMKEPSMLKLAQDLLYKELLLALPEVLDTEDMLSLTDRIEEYIIRSFE